MSKILKYSSGNDENPDIKPSKFFIPDWYKNIQKYNSKNVQFINGGLVKNVKSCIPFLDSLTSGYTITLWTDVYVEKRNETQIIKWNDDPPVILRDSKINPMPTPNGYSDMQYAWVSPYILEMPKGYSGIITHPLNRFDLPFLTVTGIFDDFLGTGTIPFFIKKDFEGMIKAGTPIMQVIPLKRDNWKIKKDNLLIEKNKENLRKVQKVFFNWYKDNRWVRKEYL